MKILPVLDLLEGIVVRGVAGQRNEYRPVESCLTESPAAIAVADAFREKLGLDEFYMADLDAILHKKPNLDIFQKLANHDFQLMIDAGLRDLEMASEVLNVGAASVVAGLETIPGPGFLAELGQKIGNKRVVFSLDMQAGELLGDLSQWDGSSPFEIACEAIAAGIERMIVLDLAQVGVGQGISTDQLCHLLRSEYPNLEIITGGGVRNLDDLRRLEQANVDSVLVASAVHNGTIGRAELDQLTHSASSTRSKTSG